MNIDEEGRDWVKPGWNNSSDYIWVIRYQANLHRCIPPPTLLWPLNIMYNFRTAHFYVSCMATLPVASKLNSINFQKCKAVVDFRPVTFNSAGEMPVTYQDEQTHKWQPQGVLSSGMNFDRVASIPLLILRGWLCAGKWGHKCRHTNTTRSSRFWQVDPPPLPLQLYLLKLWSASVAESLPDPCKLWGRMLIWVKQEQQNHTCRSWVGNKAHIQALSCHSKTYQLSLQETNVVLQQHHGGCGMFTWTRRQE